MDDIHVQHGWWSLNIGEQHNYELPSQFPRNSVSTFSSSCSSAAPSLFSNPARCSQALSVASSQTGFSSASAQSACSGSSAYSTHSSESMRPNASRLLIRPSPKQKKATNPYSCSHCSETFSKRADRKKHIRDKCPYLGQGSICPCCLHVGRNKHQVDKYQRSSGHCGPCAAVDANDKHAFTCSNDGRIYRSLEEYINHFSSELCHLNRAGASRHHRSRLRTLLSEGRDDGNGHSYIYAALVDYCRRKKLLLVFNHLIDSLSEDAAQVYAERLEWGYMPDDGSAHTRLGYTSFKDMVDEILTWSARNAITDTSRPSDTHTRPDQLFSSGLRQHPMSPRKQIPQHSVSISKPLSSAPVPRDRQGLQSAAVTEATAMLQEDPVLRNWPEQYSVSGRWKQSTTGYKTKWPRSLPTLQQQEATVLIKSVNTQPDPVRQARQIATAEQDPSGHLYERKEDLDAFIEWPEQHSLTPPLTARNLSFATRSQVETPSTRTSSEKRHAGIWEWSFEEAFPFEQDS
ncbi:hypothetical protein DOTSEDRAFT_36857 [Dothistroma septosporum NZE10]|uniref:C2H2-type domain-containing protein n=1 Tax=Dothistroma septosporum (strain NZE10 / CBS 128990) TaxID=675120 RepID=N1PGF3_DOTSN|nr:hypothetical protein DOTSEDRAFT_36857 [Dothistroma septosporum NZE10]